MGTDENEVCAAASITLMANGYSQHALLKLSSDAQRNTLIVKTSQCSGQSVAWLQSQPTLTIAMLMNQGGCCR